MAEMISSTSIPSGTSNVIEKVLSDLSGGRELDLTGVTTEYDANDGYIHEGTPIILDGGAYKPLLAANLVADGPKIIGFLVYEVHKDKPYAAICTQGVVNEDKLPFALDAAAKAAVKGAIVFQ